MERHITHPDELTRPFVRPALMGILNVTEDSFSDGGLFLDPESAIQHGTSLLAAGADIIDIGAASSNISSIRVDTETEIRRLDSVMEPLKLRGAVLSVDSFNPDVQLFALSRGADILNDIQGFPDSRIYDQLAASGCRLVVMHSVQRIGPATSVDVNPEIVLQEVFDFFLERIKSLTAAGISESRLILDPGMGFFLGSNPQASFSVLKSLRKIKSFFNMPILVSVSRKSFLRLGSSRPVGERGSATLAAEIYCAYSGVDYIRTHDVRAAVDAFEVLGAIHSNGK